MPDLAPSERGRTRPNRDPVAIPSSSKLILAPQAQ
jgi:hypothetical protein